MAGTFSSFNTALTALRYQQVSLDVASTNVANVGTEGYVRRRVVGETLGAASQPALWSRTENPTGAGVVSSGTQRLTDALLDARVRRENATQSQLDVAAQVLARVETGLGEPGDNGIAARIDDFRSSLHDLANNPESAATRSQVLASAQSLADGIRLQASQVNAEIDDQRTRLAVAVSEVNGLASDLAETNKAILAGRGTDTSTLEDTRDLLALELARLTGATAEIRGDGQMTVTLGGQTLVEGQSARALQATTEGREPVTFSIEGVAVSVASGEAGAMATLVNDTLPVYLAGLDTLARTLAANVNTQHQAGYDAEGQPGGPLFALTPGSEASTIAVVPGLRPGQVAASAIGDPTTPTPVLDSANASALAEGIGIEDGYRRLVNEFGTRVASAKRLAANQTVLTTQVDAARDQQTGVSLDEETVNLMLAQRGYEAAARVMSTMDEMLDTLINRMAI